MKISFLEKLFKSNSAEQPEEKDQSANQIKTGVGETRDAFESQSSHNEFFSGKRLSGEDLQKEQNYTLPEVDDEVLVAFEKGDMRSPYVVGNLWSSDDKPPEADRSNEKKKNEPEEKDS